MRLILVACEESSGTVRLLSNATFKDRASALAELESTVAAQDKDGIEHFIVDLESATPVLMLSAPASSAPPAAPEEPVAGAWEAPLADGEDVPPMAEGPDTAPEAAAERPVAQAGPAITPPSDEDLAASVQAAATALEPSAEVASPDADGGLDDLLVAFDESPAAEPDAIDDAGPEAGQEAAVLVDVDTPTQVEAATDEAADADPAAAVVEQGETAPVDVPAELPAKSPDDAEIQWPWEKPGDDEPVLPVRESLGAVEAPAQPDATEEKAYEPAALNLQQYTCDDCVYVNTCPNREQKAPYECGSFQWKSG
jgi:hypothetical protein